MLVLVFVGVAAISSWAVPGSISGVFDPGDRARGGLAFLRQYLALGRHGQCGEVLGAMRARVPRVGWTVLRWPEQRSALVTVGRVGGLLPADLPAGILLQNTIVGFGGALRFEVVAASHWVALAWKSGIGGIVGR